MQNISANDFLKTAVDTAEFFGFRSPEELKKAPECRACKEKMESNDSAAERKKDDMHGMLTNGLTSYCDARLNAKEGPSLFYTTEKVPRTGDAAISLQVYGVEKSIAEAILIQSVRSLLNEVGYTNHSVRVNSLGDPDSVTRYVRELTNYLRKRIDHMPISARELMKDHALTALMHLIEKGDELGLKSPSPLEYLSDSSRKHFREIVEYLDMSETPYEIDPKLMGHHHCYTDAIFAVDVFDEEGKILDPQPIYVRGGRYNEFINRSTKNKVSAVGAVVVLREKKAPARTPRPSLSTVPSVYIVQLGFGPKVRSLLMIDELRKAGIQVHQDLACDSLSTQLRDAEAKKVKHTIIIGQKEYVEGTVILRDMEARSQEHVPQSQLASRLRRTVSV